MFLQNIRVRNFRSILDETLSCDVLTALVGRNGSGKSSFLSALELFYNPSAKVVVADFFAEDTSKNIEVSVTYSDLNDEEREFFSAYIDNNILTVVRVFSLLPSQKSGVYYGMRMQNSDFVAVRNAGGNGAIRQEYSKLRQSSEYSSLPAATSAEVARQEMSKWEAENPEHCSLQRDDGQFFGFTQVAQGYLGKYTRFIHIPAVRDAREDATESRGAPITELMNLLVRSVLANRTDVTEFKKQTQERYGQIMDPTNLTELSSLEVELSNTLKSFVPDSSVNLEWSEFAEISIPMPEAQVKLVEDDYESFVERTGHGLQRAFIVTILQHLAAARGSASSQAVEGTESEANAEGLTTSETSQLPSVVLAIEEPELYQHPSRQRHLASVLLKLATGTIPGVAKHTQIIYSTHSPLLVGQDRFSQIRVLRKLAHESGVPKSTYLSKADMGHVARVLWEANGSKGDMFSAETLLPRLHAIMTPWMNEGFFADKVVLVEGEDDRAAIIGAAMSVGYDLDSLGITVIPCFGKPNLDRPLVIFRQLEIPVYVVWDGDQGGKDAQPESNKYLLRLLGESEQDWPAYVGPSSTCFKTNLDKTIEEEISKELFDSLISKSQEELCIPKRDQARKNAEVIHRVVQEAAAKGNPCKSLVKVVENIVSFDS